MERPLTMSPSSSEYIGSASHFIADLSSAGSRDSELTNHGFQQAIRLGQHFKTLGLSFTHLFSSHLQRAAKTAGKIREAQLNYASDEGHAGAVPDVVQLPILMEKDFGSMEGKKWDQVSKDSTGFVDVESQQAMAQRADLFLVEHLMPLLDESTIPANPVVAIVSHGIFLSTLWKRLLRRLPPKSVTLCLDASVAPRLSLEHLGGWSNTGYLELHMSNIVVELPSSTPEVATESVPQFTPLLTETLTTDGEIGEAKVPQITPSSVATTETSIMPAPAVVALPAVPLRITRGWTTNILTINGKDHLKGLKRTGGGVGSSRHDASQKGIETFFKRRKTD